MNQKPKRVIDSYIVFYENLKFEDCRFENHEHIRRTDIYICKIAILNIDSISNCIIVSLRNIEVLKFASPKWFYVLKSVEKWLSKTRRYKTVVGATPSRITPPFWRFEKKIFLQYFFFLIDIFKSNVSNDLNEN
jgi:hypothetical protein